MTDERVLYILKNLGVHYDDFRPEVCEKMYKIGIAFAKMVEEEHQIRKLVWWYDEGMEQERQACIQMVEAEIDNWDNNKRESLQNIMNELRSRSEGGKPIVSYTEIPKDQVFGRHFFKVVASQDPEWKVGDTFSDDDMSMGSFSVDFTKAKGK